MKREELIEELTARGWVVDKWGHLRRDMKMVINGQERIVPHRVKMLKTSVRLERRNIHGTTSDWYLMTRSYFKTITTTPEGGLKIGSATFKPRKALAPVAEAN